MERLDNYRLDTIFADHKSDAATNSNNGSENKNTSHKASRIGSGSKNNSDIICFSHLRWDFVFQRPQHLLTRCSSRQRVFFMEDPIFMPGIKSHLEISRRDHELHIIVPKLSDTFSPDTAVVVQQKLLDSLLQEYGIEDFLLWYYTPMALGFSQHLSPMATIYDCMDELSSFKGAPRSLREYEAELFGKADVVFTGGQSLYEYKKNCHHNIHPFPSSIDAAHFAKARKLADDVPDQLNIPHPRIGFCGVIDERLDIDLLREVADMRPDWHLVMLGPVVKIDPAILPQRHNIHYLGGKKYEELPHYLAGWDVAMMPFALNESTRFISPTKTPEYLAAGRPVVSAPLQDVVRPYGERNLVRIAGTPEEFVQVVEGLLENEKYSSEWLRRVDDFLSSNSWDSTWSRMMDLIDKAISDGLYESAQELEVLSVGQQSMIIDTATA